MGWNIFCRAERGRYLGWEPYHGVEEIEQFIVEEVVRLAKC